MLAKLKAFSSRNLPLQTLCVLLSLILKVFWDQPQISQNLISESSRKGTLPKRYRNSNQNLSKGCQLRGKNIIKGKGVKHLESSAQGHFLSCSLVSPYMLPHCLDGKLKENPCGVLIFLLPSLFSLFHLLFYSVIQIAFPTVSYKDVQSCCMG